MFTISEVEAIKVTGGGPGARAIEHEGEPKSPSRRFGFGIRPRVARPDNCSVILLAFHPGGAKGVDATVAQGGGLLGPHGIDDSQELTVFACFQTNFPL